MYEKVGNILKTAKESNTAAIAFICMDYVMARTVVYAAEATNTPAIVMLFPEHVTIQHTTGFEKYAAMVKELAGEVKVPIGLHCDHDYSYEAIMRTISAGFGSVMMDGSMNDLDTNIAVTKKVVEAAHKTGVFVEGEIGHVGTAADSDNDKTDLYTKPEAAEKFCKESGVDSLAISIGNAHGEYRDTPHLDIRRLEDIHAATSVPLVLHGGSGIPDDQLLVAFSKGINKFNLGTEFLGKYFQSVSDFAAENANNPDPVKIINMPEYVQSKLQPYVEGRMRTLCKF
ncbi:MAG: class II fructose-bisphosphate aldolase [Dorea sp.]|mgnify:FL=1|jgi:ketose-bisphosphate aldolase|uniref:class II fructose-bisphosphate aldolase n=1 Tax=Sporofaciens musculi TaxID=2681861 RepID=UPI00217103F9|nr:class II fructose-bisphosphate aldolase [Sporofaciens musculi]MCI9422422.1 class II fructose-bisphosphate aldolase [Dorea sp.]